MAESRNMSLYGSPYPQQLHEIPYNLLIQLCDSLNSEDKKSKLATALGYQMSQFRCFERLGGSSTRSMLQDYSCRRGNIRSLYKELVRLKMVREALILQPFVPPFYRVKLPSSGTDKCTDTEDLGFDTKNLVVLEDV